MTFLKLAPFAQSYDFWIAIFFCMASSLIWLFFAWRASRSGSIISTTKDHVGYRVETESDKNIPIYKTGYFAFFCLHVVLGQVFFWAMLWPDYQDVWFVK